MGEIKGYRLKVGALADLSRIVDAFRRDAMKILARDLARLVARQAVFDLDLVRLGLSTPHSDLLARANSRVAAMLSGRDYVLNGRDFNCKIQFYMVESVVLVKFLSGNADYLRAWENRKDVVRWNWTDGTRPAGISEKDWATRRRTWDAALKKPTLGAGLKFVLVDEELPALGWNAVHRYAPDYDLRMSHALEKLQACLAGDGTKQEPERVRLRVRRAIPEKLTKDLFLDPTEFRGEVETTAVKIAVKKPSAAPAAARKIMIDHADVILAGDGRTFVAVPYVALAADARVFIQLSGTHVNFIQGGIQYGTVTNVPRAATDHLKMCDTVTLVETEISGGRRLLRARHVAIVKDISMFEAGMRPLVGVSRMQGGRLNQEAMEWNKAQ